MMGTALLATTESPTRRSPNNSALNAYLARDPALRRSVSVEPQGTCSVDLPIGDEASRKPSPSPASHRPPFTAKRRATTADVLEALHQVTGLPIVADFYTRLYSPESVSVQDQPLFAVLNQLADTMRLRWSKEGSWLQFRSATFYDDRLKEVPNRLLNHWVSVRQQHRALPLDHLVEVAQLSDAQLDSQEMAEGARLCWGLLEWDLGRAKHRRPHLRFLASFTRAQRQEAMSPNGLTFGRLSLPQQQQFIALAMGVEANWRKLELDDLARAALRLEYLAPGGFQWVVPNEPGQPLRLVPRPPLPAETRAARLESARRFDPDVSEELALARAFPELDLKITYTLGAPERQMRRRVSVTGGGFHGP
jgi:hypothetical protein